MNDYEFPAIDFPPLVSMMYKDLDEEYKLTNIDTSYFDLVVEVDGKWRRRCPLLKVAWDIMVQNFELYYATREIGGETQKDFYDMMQSCLNRNADTFERHLEVYWDDIANPILGRTEKVTYDTLDDRHSKGLGAVNYGHKINETNGGSDVQHHVEVPADAPQYDTDRSRDKTDYGSTSQNQESGVDSQETSNEDKRTMTGTVTTELSDLGVRPNYESLNGFLVNNKTFIQFFIETFNECFAPRYKRVYF